MSASDGFTAWDIIHIVEASISILTCSAIIISLIHINYIKPPSTKTKPVVIKLTISTDITYLLAMIFRLITFIFISESLLRQLLNTIGLILWNIVSLCIINVKTSYAFNGTKYAISKRIYITFIVLMILYCISWTVYIIHKIIYFQQHRQNIHQLVDVDLGDSYDCAEIIDLIISVLLIFLFCKNDASYS